MKVGVCVSSIEQWKGVAENGYDYIETLFSHFATATEEQYEEMVKTHKECGLDVEATMCFFNATLKLYAYDPATGEGTPEFEENLEKIREYTHIGMSRATKLGLKISVIGSGAARKVPEDMKREVAVEQFSRMLGVVGDVAAEYGVRIAIEPLNKSETNLANTLAESLEICRALNHPNVFVLNDFYHSRIENETYDALHDAGDLLIHTHICDTDRTCPTLEKDGDYLLTDIKELVSTGYDARVSFECGFKPDFITAIKNARSLADAFKAI